MKKTKRTEKSLEKNIINHSIGKNLNITLHPGVKYPPKKGYPLFTFSIPSRVDLGLKSLFSIPLFCF